MSSIVLCADDFGLSSAIDAGILGLVGAGRLSATGCMVAGERFEADAAALRAVADRIDVGLHLTLTQLPPLAPVPSIDPTGAPASLGRVLGRALTGRLAYAEIAAEIGRQVDRFRAVVGREPDFVDGHQHVHLFPGVRRALFSLFDEGVLDARRTWLRDCRESPATIVRRGVEVPKALFIAALASGFAAQARVRGIAVNRGFAGITAFRPEAFAGTFPKFLRDLEPGALVMCHPADAAAPADASDEIDRARRAEYAYLSSDAFLAALAAAGVRPARFAVASVAGEGAGE
ncbi:MAG: ChbG/HpnK family deacetylase [Phyllobacteriaceae bacterium]|nr:ChbG/HpnK family deacetylase [Phyllobacteriaceae bacterium]